jgi:uncharacterized protein YgiM (DUF1202 family)
MTLRPALAIGVLVLVSLACGQYVPTVTPTAQVTPEPQEAATQPATPTPAPSPVPTAADVAVIVVPAVNVRAEPDGAVIGSLAAGDSVTVLECRDSWCQVEYLEQTGYIWAGCLSIESGLGCEAK